ncbi:MAG: protein serine/threonine phosphatase [Actinomycetia bacterium]|jgi:serine/threonine protein phosphatase PrpC|nr:protein serine/threonine phosphatase [Actinomycetes bacterium]
MNVTIAYAAGSDIGCNRENNEDSAYAGPWLLAVADGMGGYAGGEVASSTVIGALRSFDAEVPADQLVETLGRAVTQAHETLRGVIGEHPELDRMGTTLTAMLWSGTQVALAHIGDSRGYLLRDGELFQMTQDHTLDKLLGEGGGGSPRLSHMLFRVLDGSADREPDLSPRTARLGDRYLLCSDGLTGPVGPEAIYDVLTGEADRQTVVKRLIELAKEGGGPDNITCVIADVVEAPEGSAPVVVGAAAEAH